MIITGPLAAAYKTQAIASDWLSPLPSLDDASAKAKTPIENQEGAVVCERTRHVEK